MSVVVVGVHERDVPLEVLERVTIPPGDLAKALRRLCDSPHLSEAVVVSTCLRTEVYAVVERFHDGVADIEAFFESRAGSGGVLPPARDSAGGADDAGSGREDAMARPDSPPGGRVPGGPLVTAAVLSPGHLDRRGGPGPYGAGGVVDGLYCAIDDAAAEHLFEVAAGIDSAVLGEGEILRQVRQSLESARSGRAAGPVLERMFRHAVEVGKRARSETAIARGITSLSHAAVALAAETLGGSLAGRRVLVVGAGEMGAGMISAIERLPVPPSLVVASRTRARAEEAALRIGGETVDLDGVRRVLAEIDVLFTSTAAAGVIFDEADVAPAVAERGGRPLLVVDAAVPRDVDTAVGSLEGVTLLDMDNIRGWAERQMAGRAGEIERVRSIVGEELERYRAASAARYAAPVVSSLHELGEALRNEELERHRNRLGSLDDAQRAAVEALTKGIVAKLLHEPTVRLKDAAGTPRGERLAESLRALFDL